jgi:hypothetical protein
VNKFQIYALGQDAYWLDVVKNISGETFTLEIIQCPGDLRDCLYRLPRADVKTLVLIDASWQSDIENMVQSLRSLGWSYIVVVAADPSVKEARAILRGNLGYDYWKKTYVASVIQSYINKCLEEIETDLSLTS